MQIIGKRKKKRNGRIKEVESEGRERNVRSILSLLLISGFLNFSGLKVCLLLSGGASLFRFSKILNLPVQKGLSPEAPPHLLSIREEGDAGSREIIKSQQTCDLQFSQISSCI